MPTQIREIRYRGFSTSPDDYAVPDGDLEGVSGLVPEDEALKPIQPPAAIFDLPKGKTIDHVHVPPSFATISFEILRRECSHTPRTGGH